MGMTPTVNWTEDLGQGFQLEQLQEPATGALYYRVCKNGICRYAEDDYIARMYAEQMCYDKSQPEVAFY